MKKIEFIIKRRSGSPVIRVPKEYQEEFKKFKVAKVIIIPVMEGE